MMIWEALYGERPFAGADARALEEAVRRGPPPPPRKSPVPPPIAAVLQRALAVAPAGRYPSVDAFLAALDRAARDRRWPLWLGAGAVGLAGVAVAAVTLRGATPSIRARARPRRSIAP
ncbi:MAG: hypothetical protein IPL61_16900 [Myxococcales bacterium]|nr:hypothetical protein [Myxococcales bacterium]